MTLYRLDLQYFAGEKTEKATPKKRQEARKKGQVAKSQEINTALVLLSVFLVLRFGGNYFLEKLTNIFYYTFQDLMNVPLTEENIFPILINILKELVLVMTPIMLVALVAGVAANILQFGFLFSTEPIQFKIDKLDPIKGMKRIFSLRAIVELLKSILKITLVGVVVFSILWMKKDEILVLSDLSVGASLASLAKLTAQMGIIASVVLLFLAILDYMYQRFDYEKNLRMSKQEIKDEYKNTEGDPLIKSKIKQRQREMAMRRMMQEVPKADVVITNPTHYAVALKYDEQSMEAPIVVAKGADYIAQKIKFIAKENGVITVENRPLARALYDQTDIGDVIPEEFFKAVAEILAYVYKTKKII